MYLSVTQVTRADGQQFSAWVGIHGMGAYPVKLVHKVLGLLGGEVLWGFNLIGHPLVEPKRYEGFLKS